MLGRAKSTAREDPGPEVKTVWVGNLPAETTEAELRDRFYVYGEIASVKVISAQGIAFVEYSTHEAAKTAVDACVASPPMFGSQLTNIDWAKPKKQADPDMPQVPVQTPPVGVASSAWGAFYPSMNPQRMGAYPETQRPQQYQQMYAGYAYSAYPYPYQAQSYTSQGTIASQPAHMIPKQASKGKKDGSADATVKKRAADSTSSGTSQPKRQKTQESSNE